MPWACERCQTIHTQNAKECRSCGHPVFQPVSRERLEQRSTGVDAPQSIEIEENQLTGQQTDPEYSSSPDVSLDGSIKNPGGSENVSVDASRGGPGRIRSWYYKLRATIKAPILLCRDYIIPILAFLTVIEGIVALVLSVV